MSLYNDQQEFLRSLRDLIENRHRKFAGAQFRVAFVRDEKGVNQFLTGCALLLENQAISRPAQDYRYIVLAEEWVEGDEAVLHRIEQIVSGTGAIANAAVGRTFTHATLTRKFDAAIRGWGGWEFSSRVDHTAQERETYLRQEPLLAFGLRPYNSAFEAILRWVFEEKNTDFYPPGNRAPNQGEFLTLVADTRARIVRAEWLPGLVNAEVELGVDPREVEAQFLFAGAEDDTRTLNTGSLSLKCEVPEGTRTTRLMLVHSTNDCISKILLNGEYDTYGPQPLALSAIRKAELDLKEGENDHVEYKPWVSPKSPEKEAELVETIIAFANTGGGRLYVGAADSGNPLGDTALSKAFKVESDMAAIQQAERIKSLKREKIKPVPPVRVELITVFGERLVLVEVERGSRRPYSTFENKVFVRKGGSNRLADPHSELPALSPQSLLPDGS